MADRSADVRRNGVGEMRHVAPSCRPASMRRVRTRRLCSREVAGSSSVGGEAGSGCALHHSDDGWLDRHDSCDFRDTGFQPALDAHGHGHAGGRASRACALEKDFGGAVRRNLEELAVAAVHLQRGADPVEGILDPPYQQRAGVLCCVHSHLPCKGCAHPTMPGYGEQGAQALLVGPGTMMYNDLPMEVSKPLARPRTLPIVVEQIVPSRVCFTCDVCCRFPEPDSPLRPYFTREEIQAAMVRGISPDAFPDHAGSKVAVVSHGEGYRCPAFQPETGQWR